MFSLGIFSCSLPRWWSSIGRCRYNLDLWSTNFLIHLLYFMAPHLKPNIEIWQFLPSFHF
jgi:hypothetical protein